jgi:toxin-antitoxin system PIN domain toxin
LFAVDTNLLLYAVNRDAPTYERANGLLDSWREGTEEWFATWPVLYEFLRVATHPKVFEEPRTWEQAWEFIQALFASPSFGVLVETPRHAEVARELGAEYPWVAGSIMHDFHTVVLMREHGVTEIRTADSDFRRFAHLRVVNPLTT